VSRRRQPCGRHLQVVSQRRAHHRRLHHRASHTQRHQEVPRRHRQVRGPQRGRQERRERNPGHQLLVFHSFSPSHCLLSKVQFVTIRPPDENQKPRLEELLSSTSKNLYGWQLGVLLVGTSS
jgi:hypothetical protein